MVCQFPAPPYTQNRRVILIKDIRACSDPGIRASGLLQIADGEHQRHQRITPSLGERRISVGRPQADAGQ